MRIRGISETSHFPKTIPLKAENVKFSYSRRSWLDAYCFLNCLLKQHPNKLNLENNAIKYANIERLEEWKRLGEYSIAIRCNDYINENADNSVYTSQVDFYAFSAHGHSRSAESSCIIIANENKIIFYAGYSN